MATGSVAFTFDPGLNKNFSMESAARVANIAFGTCDFQASYTTGGITVNLPFNNLDWVDIQLSSGYIPQFDYTNSLIKVFAGGSNTATAAVNELADGTDLASWSALRFLAVGH